MKYEVLIYGDPTLRKKAAPIENVDNSIRQLAKNMLKTMYGHNGLGLAAEQIGHMESICVIDVPPDQNTTGHNPDVSMPLVMINPRITEMSGEQTGQEGCLSFPGIFVSIPRSAEVTVTFVDPNNQERTIKVNGLLARIVEHEVDHLFGILLVDHMSSVQKAAVEGKLRRLKKRAE